MSEQVVRKAGDRIRFCMKPTGKNVYEGVITNVVESEGEAYYHIHATIGDEEVEDGLIFEDEVVKDEQQETLWQIVQEVAEYDYEHGPCPFCKRPFIHDEDCIITKARELLEQRKAQAEVKCEN